MPMLNVRPAAERDVDNISAYIGDRNSAAGRRFILAARREFEFLAENPLLGAIRDIRRKNLKGMRSWPIDGFRNYLIFYIPLPDGVEIFRVLHGARHINRALNEEA
jgi:toxin ParE1/3/4